MSTSKRGIREATAGYLYILPSFILILVFSIIPILMSIFFSFTQYNVIQPPKLIGLSNYLNMAQDPTICAAIVNTLLYTLMVVPIQTILSMILAQVIASMFRGHFGNALKSAYFIPVISSAVLVGTLWTFLLQTDGGAVNAVLGLFGIPAVNWLGSTSTALPAVGAVSVWKNVGYFLVIFYAGIMDIPRSQFEAAEVDGATQMQCFRYITIPALKPITSLVVTLGTIWSFQVFDIVYVMTGGGPGNATETLVLDIYNSAFKQYMMGYASAVSTLLFAIVIVITMLQRLLFRDKEAMT